MNDPLGARDAELIALSAIPYLIGDETLSSRFLQLSGLRGDQLREQIEEPGFQAAVLKFFLDHEPDLLALSDALGMPADRIASAWHILSGPSAEAWP